MKKNKLLGKVFAWLSGIVCVLLLIWILFSAWMISRQQVPQLFGYSVLRIVSGSMEPEIPVGSCIFVKSTDPRDLLVGDVISFYSTDEKIEGAPNTHKIVNIEQKDGAEIFTTQGIANSSPDTDPVYGDHIIGKYVGKAVIFEWAGKLVSNPVIFLFIIVIPLLGIMMFEVRNLLKAAREKDTDQEE